MKPYVNFLTFSLILVTVNAFSQSDNDLTLKDHYRSIYDKAETYEQYKVFKSTTINTFWSNVEDSIRKYKQEIVLGQQKITSQNNQIDSLSNQINKLEQALSKSRAEADSIGFLGIPLSESFYHIMAWSIIAALGILTFIGYGSHTRSKKLYNTTRKEHMKLMEELEGLRKKYLEYKVRMGRELQTERNKIADLENRLSTSSSNR